MTIKQQRSDLFVDVNPDAAPLTQTPPPEIMERFNYGIWFFVLLFLLSLLILTSRNTGFWSSHVCHELATRKAVWPYRMVSFFLLCCAVFDCYYNRWVFEKYDGIRAIWNPKRRTFYTRWGSDLFIPNYIVDTITPHFWMDSEVILL